jgi:hypothetical protein
MDTRQGDTMTATATQREVLLQIAAGYQTAGRTNTSRVLRERGLVVSRYDARGCGGLCVSDAGLALFAGQRFAVVYAIDINGRRGERIWTGGIDLATAIAEVADLRDLGNDDPCAIPGQFRIVPQPE